MRSQLLMRRSPSASRCLSNDGPGKGFVSGSTILSAETTPIMWYFCWRQWRIRIPFPGGAAEAPGSDQFHEETDTSNAQTDSPHRGDRNKSDHAKNRATAAAAGERRRWAVGGGVRRVGEGGRL
ncbi:calcineurin B-like protein 1 [Dorcoceras hygrometricum]|uniref:Calcineurin B-like protein 1 n=1 Tax=Dorcoceras hygrometricum TaxID=472368 RepID=A0A2Z7AHY2_9LAMI|nr:calcineurin B-like protein 1 [Dorcoceras hygrometricum]